MVAPCGSVSMNHGAALLRWAKRQVPGHYAVTDVKDALGMGEQQWKRLVEKMHDARHWLGHEMQRSGVSYFTSSAKGGRYTKSFIVITTTRGEGKTL